MSAKTLILYLYKEDLETRENLAFFLENGVKSSTDVDYLFIINDFKYTVSFPTFKNVQILPKENSFDLNAYMIGLKFMDYGSYDYFIFINSSCIGPFLTVFETRDWHKVVTDLLSQKVKLVAPVIEVPSDNLGASALLNYKYLTSVDTNVPFLHTYMFSTDRSGLDILIKGDAFPENIISQNELIHKYERLISSLVLNEGYEIKSFLLKYKAVDFSLKENWIWKKWSPTKKTCHEIPGNYDGIDVHPLEVMFTKNLRRAHKFRSWRAAGISTVLKRYIKNYISWTKPSREQ